MGFQFEQATEFDGLQTPFYLFDEGRLIQRVNELRAALPKGVKICYAMKANSFVLDAASHAADLVEVCSPGELATCRALGIPDERLVISGVYKERAQMRALIASKAPVHRITAESTGQFFMLEQLAREEGTSVPVLLRLTSGNQFGMDLEDLRDIVAHHRVDGLVRICGIQFFSGTQKRSAKRVRRELEHLDGIIAELRDVLGEADLELEYGTGMPVEYCEPDEAVTSSADHAFLEGLSDALSSMRFDGTKILEFGRAISACCGTYVTRVVDTKRNKGHDYAIVDGGKHQLVFYGQSLALKPPVAHFVPNKAGGDVRTWTICGALCTAGDTLVAQAECGELGVGDLVVFPNAGAYCMTEGISLFLSRDLPSVYLRDAAGDTRLVRERIETSPINTPDGLHNGLGNN